MKRIAYYISDYGYGHASRSIAIIRELLQKNDINITVCHSFAQEFIKRSLHNTNSVGYRKINTDIGYFLKKDSIYPDKIRLSLEYKNFMSNWDELIRQEQAFLVRESIDLVISDISPIAFEPAYQLGIPSIGISNFTWYTAYQGLLSTKELTPLYQAYRNMTYFYTLAGCKEPDWTANRKDFGFFARTVDAEEVKRISEEINPNGKRVIFVGFGMKLNTNFLENLPLWNSPDCVFIVSSNVKVKHRENIFKIPFDYLETQNYIAASDLVITKAGWGTVSEAVTSQIPLLIIERDTMAEDRNTVNYLKNQHLCHTIQWSDFNQLVMNDKEMESYIKLSKLYKNESMEIARNILSFINCDS
ncbi:glycosyltransferase [Bacillus sp. Y1]|nr:glycosyltransferase [Bacillus sp. Y1]